MAAGLWACLVELSGLNVNSQKNNSVCVCVSVWWEGGRALAPLVSICLGWSQMAQRKLNIHPEHCCASACLPAHTHTHCVVAEHGGEGAPDPAEPASQLTLLT